MVNDEHAAAAPHFPESGVGQEGRSRGGVGPAEDPRRAARGESLLHFGAVEVVPNVVGGPARQRLDRDEQHGGRGAGCRAGAGVVVEPLHAVHGR